MKRRANDPQSSAEVRIIYSIIRSDPARYTILDPDDITSMVLIVPPNATNCRRLVRFKPNEINQNNAQNAPDGQSRSYRTASTV